MRRIAYALVLPIFFAFLFWSAFTWWTKVLVVDPTWITWLTGDLGVESWAQEHLTDYDRYGEVTTYDEDGQIRKTLVDLTEEQALQDCVEGASLRPVPGDSDGQHVVVLNPCTPSSDRSLGVNEFWEKLLTGFIALVLLIPIGFVIFSVYRNNIWWPKEMDRDRIKPEAQTLGGVVLKILEIAFFAAVLLILVVSVWEAVSFLLLDSVSIFDNLQDTLGSLIGWAIVATTFLIAYDFILEKARDDPSPYGSGRH
jgi:hypothetical protein